MKSLRNDLVKLWKNRLLLVVLNQRRQAKVQYEKMLEELVPKYRKEFANFDIFANHLDDFLMPLLSAKKLDIDILFESWAACFEMWL